MLCYWWLKHVVTTYLPLGFKGLSRISCADTTDGLAGEQINNYASYTSSHGG
jgi:hypothetical protein